MKIPTDERIGIGLPRGSGTRFNYEFIAGLFSMFGYSPCNYAFFSEAKVHHIARNSIFKSFKNSDMNYLLTIDSDMIWEKEGLEQAYNLIQHDEVDIVTGIYHTKSKPHLPVIKKLDLNSGAYNIYMDWDDKPFEVDGAGMGFMLIPKYVIEELEMPYCDWEGGFSEDLNFCLKAKLAGFRLWADPSIQLGHIGQKVITRNDWEKQHKKSVEAWVAQSMVHTKRILDKQYPDRRKRLGIHPLDFKNINTKEYWDMKYKQEGGKKTWRVYPERSKEILKLIKKENPSVLELGCGVGIFAKDLKDFVKGDLDYYGIDISEYAIQELREAGFEGKVKKIPPIDMDRKFDYIIGLELLEHLDDEPRLKLIKEISEMCDTAIFIVPNNCMTPEEVSEHRVVYDKESFLQFLLKAFDKVRVNPILLRESKQSIAYAKYLLAVCERGKNDVQKKSKNKN
jgi:2-polyprenyl-3-methyl-5-hydroxy-6-metoxy-1,4-benzoquinol methylase